jgi:uncharacterized membrane protein
MEANTADFILTAPANAPWFLHLGAAILLYAHIIGASVGMVAGTVAILSRKGAPVHRAAGNVFFVAMLAMTGVASAVAPFLGEAQWTNTTAGVFTLYLVATGWATVKRPEGQIGRFEAVAFLVALGMAGTGLVLFLLNAGKPQSSAFATVYGFAIVAGIAALCDLGVILRKGISGRRRIARHLWRMSLALVVALGSFFVGQQDELPAFVQGSAVLAAPMLIALGLMAFWLIRARFTKAFQPNQTAIQAS